MGTTRNRKPSRCITCARFVTRGVKLCTRCTAPALAAPDLWSPSAAWLVPTSADKARVRAAVEAADLALAWEHAEWTELHLAAKRREVAARSAQVEALVYAPEPTQWAKYVAFTAFVLAPVLWLAHTANLI